MRGVDRADVLFVLQVPGNKAGAVHCECLLKNRARTHAMRDYLFFFVKHLSRDSCNAAARMNNLSYSRLMHGLKQANVEIDRKVLADLAISDPAGFTQIAQLATQQH